MNEEQSAQLFQQFKKQFGHEIFYGKGKSEIILSQKMTAVWNFFAPYLAIASYPPKVVKPIVITKEIVVEKRTIVRWPPDTKEFVLYLKDLQQTAVLNNEGKTALAINQKINNYIK